MIRHLNHFPARAVAALLVLCAPALLAAGPELTDAEKEEFLRTAEIGRLTRLNVGVTGSRRATLTTPGLTHDAHVQTVDERKLRFEGQNGIELNFRDSFAFNVAAYRLDRMVGFGFVPVSVVRKVAGDEASVTWWVDDVQMMAKERYENQIPPKDPAAYNDQMYNVRVFNELVYNTDANLGNLLITNDWRLCAIDFTRAFRTSRKLRSPENLVKIDRRVWEGLKALTADALRTELGDLLDKSQIKGLLARRDAIVDLFDERIAELGEAAVICDAPGH